MPQVASEKNNAVSHRPVFSPRQKAAPDRAGEASFERLLDDPAPAEPRQDDMAPRAKRAERTNEADRATDKPTAMAADKPAAGASQADNVEAKDSDTQESVSVGADGAPDQGTATTDGTAVSTPQLDGGEAMAAKEVTVTTTQPAMLATAATAVQTVATALAPLTDAVPQDAPANVQASTQAGTVTVAAAQTKPLAPAAPASADAKPAETKTPADAAKASGTTPSPALTPEGKPLAAETAQPALPQAAAEAQAKPHAVAAPEAPASQAAAPHVAAPATSTDLAPPTPQSAHISAPQSTAPAAAAAAAPPTAPAAPQSVTVPVAAIPLEIAGKAMAGKNRFEIRLDPPELGRIDVRLDVDKDGNVTSHLIVDRPDTLDLLRRDAPNLDRALQDAGLKTSGNGLQFSLRDQDPNQQQASDGPATHMIETDETALLPGSIPVDYRRPGMRVGALDIRV